MSERSSTSCSQSGVPWARRRNFSAIGDRCGCLARGLCGCPLPLLPGPVAVVPAVPALAEPAGPLPVQPSLAWTLGAITYEMASQSTFEAAPIFSNARARDIIHQPHIHARDPRERLIFRQEAMNAALAATVRIRFIAYCADATYL